MSNGAGIDHAVATVNQVVRAQGVRFMKEFLREFASSEVHIGATKEQVVRNMVRALREGHIPPSRLAEWVASIEGWGEQHIYLFALPMETRSLPTWDEGELRATYGAKFAWSATADLEFDEDLSPSRMHFDGNRFELVWQKANEGLKRDADRDLERVIGGDRYRFHAHRVVPDRSLVRFVALRRPGIAAIGVQLPLGDEHRQAVKTVRETVSEAIAFDGNFLAVDLSRAIKRLDEESLDAEGGRFESRKTKFARNSVSIEFEARGGVTPWGEQSVREVRRTLNPLAFEGASAKFSVRLGSGDRTRRVEMAMDHRMQRIYFRARMTEDEVWSVLRKLKSAGRR